MSAGDVIIVAVVVVSVAGNLFFRRTWALAWELYAGLRPRHFLLAPLIVGLIVAVILALEALWAPLSWSWLSLVHPGDEGGNIVVRPLEVPYLAPAFLLFLLITLPLLAQTEEEIFREGTAGLWSALWRSTVFGFAHCLVGVPLSAGVALTLAGLIYTIIYKRSSQGLREAVLQHLACNLLVTVTIVAILLLVSGA